MSSKNSKSLLSINPLLSDRVRLAILSTLAAEKGPIDFKAMLEILELTRGNFSTHARKLEDGGLIKIEKAFIDRKPLTTYKITKKGQAELVQYLEQIEAVLMQSLK
jgi:DNA-binding transcriptional ArsR family regulator